MYVGMFNSTPNLYTLDARKMTPSLPVVLTKNVSGHCPMPPVGHNCPSRKPFV